MPVYSVNFNKIHKCFDVFFDFCTLKFGLPEYITFYGVKSIQIYDCDRFYYRSALGEEWESISRRVFGEYDGDIVVEYCECESGFRIGHYDVILNTELQIDEVLERLYTTCVGRDLVWKLKKVTS